MADTPNSNSPSRSSTPNPRFTSQSHTAEDLLKQQTVGLVHLSDFRKRRAEALDQVSRDVTPNASGTTTPDAHDPANQPTAFKKRKKVVRKGGLSFGGDDDEENSSRNGKNGSAPVLSNKTTQDPDDSSDAAPIVKKRSLKRNNSVSFQPKVLTKSALARDAQLKESLRKEYLQMQEAVKATEFVLPFVFFDGKSTSGGMCRMKKGDFIWLFLDKARKVGATTGDRQGAVSRKDWARIGVDDLLVVRGELIIPHHFDFHHFIVNQTSSYNNKTIFPYSPEPTPATPQHLLSNTAATPSSEGQADEQSNLKTAEQRRAEAAAAPPAIPDSDLEGFNDDPALTKVVDRRWYERNKHIYPASMWEDFDPERDYSKGGRKDAEGNAYFFSR